MLVDCFLSLWFRGLINLGEYCEGKATRNHALAVYKSGALRSVNNKVIKIYFRANLFVHSCWCIVCLSAYEFEFKFDLNSNSLSGV